MIERLVKRVDLVEGDMTLLKKDVAYIKTELNLHDTEKINAQAQIFFQNLNLDLRKKYIPPYMDFLVSYETRNKVQFCTNGIKIFESLFKQSKRFFLHVEDFKNQIFDRQLGLTPMYKAVFNIANLNKAKVSEQEKEKWKNEMKEKWQMIENGTIENIWINNGDAIKLISYYNFYNQKAIWGTNSKVLNDMRQVKNKEGSHIDEIETIVIDFDKSKDIIESTFRFMINNTSKS